MKLSSHCRRLRGDSGLRQTGALKLKPPYIKLIPSRAGDMSGLNPTAHFHLRSTALFALEIRVAM